MLDQFILRCKGDNLGFCKGQNRHWSTVMAQRVHKRFWQRWLWTAEGGASGDRHFTIGNDFAFPHFLLPAPGLDSSARTSAIGNAMPGREDA